MRIGDGNALFSSAVKNFSIMVSSNQRLEEPFRKRVGILMWGDPGWEGKLYCIGGLRWEGPPT